MSNQNRGKAQLVGWTPEGKKQEPKEGDTFGKMNEGMLG